MILQRRKKVVISRVYLVVLNCLSWLLWRNCLVVSVMQIYDKTLVHTLSLWKELATLTAEFTERRAQSEKPGWYAFLNLSNKIVDFQTIFKTILFIYLVFVFFIIIIILFIYSFFGLGGMLVKNLYFSRSIYIGQKLWVYTRNIC